MTSAGRVRRLGVSAAVVDGELVPGDVAVDGDVVVEVGVGSTAGGARGGRVAVAGFVDLQVNGFADVDFSDPQVAVADYADACRALARHGVTAFLPTFPTAPPDRYPRVVPVAAEVVAAGAGGRRWPGARALGVHLEGPFLSPARAGAHPVAHVEDADAAVLDALVALAPVALVTLAPERPGALELVRSLTARGIMVSVGHSDASGSEASAAFDAGAGAVTHLWNAQRPPTAREPGVVGTALARDDVWVCTIADLAHVHRDVLVLSLRAAGGRAVVVSDVVAPAGSAPGRHTLGGVEVVVDGGAVRRDGALVGSATALDGALRNVVALGVPLVDAVAAVTARPAALLRRRDVGRLVPSGRADVVVLDDDLDVHEVLVAGEPVL